MIRTPPPLPQKIAPGAPKKKALRRIRRMLFTTPVDDMSDLEI
jgi:hypothetical protein